MLERRGSETLVLLSLLVLGGGSFLLAVPLRSPSSSPLAIATLIVLTSLTLLVGTGRFFTKRFAYSLPTLQISTCICVNHQQPQRMNWEEGSAKAPAVTVLPLVLYRPRLCQAKATDCGKSFSRQRILMRLSHGPP